MIKKSRIEGRLRIKKHIRKHMHGTTERPRLTVYRSLHHLYAQVVDDSRSQTLVAVSSLTPGLRDELKALKGTKTVAKRIGTEVGKRALEKNIKRVVFDRNGYLYHGIVRSLAEGAREAGLEF
jgi:large subunit ribosomal protein L18